MSYPTSQESRQPPTMDLCSFSCMGRHSSGVTIHVRAPLTLQCPPLTHLRACDAHSPPHASLLISHSSPHSSPASWPASTGAASRPTYPARPWSMPTRLPSASPLLLCTKGSVFSRIPLSPVVVLMRGPPSAHRFECFVPS